MSAPLTTEAVLRLMAAAVPEMARRAVAQQVRRLGFIDQDQVEGVAFATVLVDGDLTALSALNMTGSRLRQGERVLVDFYPPHGVIITGLLAEKPWGAARGDVAGGSATSAGVAFDTLSPTQVQLSGVPVLGGRRYEARFSFRARCDLAGTLVSLALQLDTGSGFIGLRDVPLTFALATVAAMSEAIQWVEPFDATEDQTVDLRLVGTRQSAAAATTSPNLASIVVADAGPTPS